jgi:hypothetical protein
MEEFVCVHLCVFHKLGNEYVRKDESRQMIEMTGERERQTEREKDK